MAEACNKFSLNYTLTGLHGRKGSFSQYETFRGYGMGATTQKGRRARELQEVEESEMGVMYLGDVTQQHGRESLGQGAPKSSSSFGIL